MADPGSVTEFTVEEANALLPLLRASLERLRSARRTVLAGSQRLSAAAAADGGGAAGREVWEALSALRRELETITRAGVVLRDAESGLVDFPSRRDGRPVFLCWRLGEDRVGYWHDPESGFASRRPL
ncbi:MAG TPA: DUF2203 domain-containing protein [Actinomycetota bacterium]|nr:DUF2203 domain-containing protein [Actinomycetota bacterium]